MINIGSNIIKNLNIGGNAIKGVYAGDNRVFPNVIPPTYNPSIPNGAVLTLYSNPLTGIYLYKLTDSSGTPLQGYRINDCTLSLNTIHGYGYVSSYSDKNGYIIFLQSRIFGKDSSSQGFSVFVRSEVDDTFVSNSHAYAFDDDYSPILMNCINLSNINGYELLEYNAGVYGTYAAGNTVIPEIANCKGARPRNYESATCGTIVIKSGTMNTLSAKIYLSWYITSGYDDSYARTLTNFGSESALGIITDNPNPVYWDSTKRYAAIMIVEESGITPLFWGDFTLIQQSSVVRFAYKEYNIHI
jgi:hypothetical protein